MRYGRRTGRLMTAVLLTLLTSPLAAYAVGQEGEAAFDFSLMDLSGTTQTLSQHFGQEVVYLFFVGYN